MFKIISLMLIFIFISYSGFIYAEGFNKREEQIKNILKILVMLKNEIIYLSVPLEETLDKISTKADEPFKKLIDSVRSNLKNSECDSVYDAISKEYKKIENEFYLNENDIKIMSDFCRSLGESGTYGQESLINMTENELKVNLKEASEISKKNVKLYRYLGICIGAMIVIFLI